jgi:hypothetical protein
MSPTEWEACKDADRMLEWVGWGKPRARQQFALAVCWEIDRLIGLDEDHRRELAKVEQDLNHAPLRREAPLSRRIGKGGAKWRRITEMVSNACLGQAVEVARQARQQLGGRRSAGQAGRAAAEHHAWQVAIIHDLFDPLFLALPGFLRWLDAHPEVERLAQVLHADGAFADLSVLGDALDDAGCGYVSILDHCRSGGPHVRGCWAVELILGRW